MKGAYTIILIFVVLSLLGMLSIPRLSFRFINQQVENVILVSYHWPNSTPEVMEREVTSLLEGVLGTLQHIKNIESSSGYQSGAISLVVDDGINLDQARFEAISVIRQVYKKLPQGVTFPRVTLTNQETEENAHPLMSFQVNGSSLPSEIRNYIEASIQPVLARLEGVASVDVYGGERIQYLLEYYPLQMQALGISENDVIGAIAINQEVKSLGWIQNNGVRQTVLLTPQQTELASITLVNRNGRLIHLSEVLKIQKSTEVATNYFRINGKSAVQLVVKARKGANQLYVARAIKNKLNDIKSSLPSGYGIRVDYNSMDHVSQSLSRVMWQSVAAILSIIALCFVAFRSWKVAFVVFSGIFATILIAALLLYLFNVDIQLFSLKTLIVSTGVVTGNIFITYCNYCRQENRKPLPFLLGNTLIMGIALSVIWLLPHQAQTEMTNFGVILLTMQAISLFVCLWLIPSAIEKIGISRDDQIVSNTKIGILIRQYYLATLFILCRFRFVFITGCILLFGIPFFSLPTRLEEGKKCADIYNTVLGNEWYTEHLKPALDKALGGFLRLFATYVYAMSFYASDEETALHIQISMPNYSTIEQVDAALKQLEAELGYYKEIDRFITEAINGQQGKITVYFKKPFDNGYFPHQMKAKVIELSNEMSGIDWNIYGVGEGFNVKANDNTTSSFNVILKGYNYPELERITVRFKEALIANPRIQDVDINKVPGSTIKKDFYAYKIKTDPYYWSYYGVSLKSLFQKIQKYDVRAKADLYSFIDNSYNGINIRPRTWRFDNKALQNEPFYVLDSLGLKIGEYSKINKEKITPTIRKIDQQYSRQVSFNYLGSAYLGENYLDLTLNNFYSQLPMGFTVEKKSFEWWKNEDKQSYKLIALSIILIYILGAVMFESLRRSSSLILAIPLSFIGIFIGFYVTSTGFDQGGYASFLYTCGIAASSVALVINEYNWQQKVNKKEPIDALVYAVINGFKNIFLLLMSTLLCLVPFLVVGPDQPFWYAFSIGASGGVVAAFLLVVWVVPIFLLFPNKGAQENLSV